MMPSTTERVPLNTPARINERIRRQTEENVAQVASGGAAAIEARLEELDQEWDVERTLEANAASLILIGAGLAALHDRRWLAVPAMVSAFLLQHAVQGWCPPVPLLRRAGVRTADEIAQERCALKALRGDFQFQDGPKADRSHALRALDMARA